MVHACQVDASCAQGAEKAMDSNKAEAAVAKLQENRAKDAEESRKRCEASHCIADGCTWLTHS